MQRYRDALNHMNAALVLCDDIRDTQLAAELSTAIGITEQRLIGDKFGATVKVRYGKP